MKRGNNLKDMSVYEASEFWDEHDFSEFTDVEEVKDIQFLFKKKKYVGIDINLYKKIKSKAKKLHKSEDSLINEWLRKELVVT